MRTQVDVGRRLRICGFGSLGRLSLRRAPFEGHRLQHLGKCTPAIAQACHGQSRAIGAGAGTRADQDPVALGWAEEVEADLGIDEGPFAHVDDLSDAAGKSAACTACNSGVLISPLTMGTSSPLPPPPGPGFSR